MKHRRIFVPLIACILILGLVKVSAPTYGALTRQSIISYGPRNRKIVALTFDDGPDPRFTPRILQILKSRNVHATFFVVGENVDKYPDLARQEVADGNVLGNHTYTHPDLKTDDADLINQEVVDGTKAIVKATGQKPTLFRPPKGLYDRDVLNTIDHMGLQPILWSATVEHHACPTPKAMADRVLGLTRNGYIILAHDGRLNRERTVESLPTLIDGLKKRGYRFVTVPQMLEIMKKDRPSMSPERLIPSIEW